MTTPAAPYRETTVVHHDPSVGLPPLVRRSSWGAILVGFVICLAVHAVLATLGLAIGFAAINPESESNPLSGFGTGTGIWYGITMIVSVFVGGLAAGRLAGLPRMITAMLHGAAVWGLTLLAMLWMAGSVAGWAVGGMVNAIGSGVTGAGQAVSSATPEINLQLDQARSYGQETEQNILGQVEQLFNQAPPSLQNQAGQAAETAAVNPQMAYAQARQTITNLFYAGADGLQPDERQQLVDLLANNTQLSPQEAEEAVENWSQLAGRVDEQVSQAYQQLQQGYQQVQQQVTEQAQEVEAEAREAAQGAAEGLASASWWAFIAMVLGLIAGAVGGMLGAPAETLAEEEARHARDRMLT